MGGNSVLRALLGPTPGRPVDNARAEGLPVLIGHPPGGGVHQDERLLRGAHHAQAGVRVEHAVIAAIEAGPHR